MSEDHSHSSGGGHDPEENTDSTTVPLLLLAGLCIAAFLSLATPADHAEDHGHPGGHGDHGSAME